MKIFYLKLIAFFTVITSMQFAAIPDMSERNLRGTADNIVVVEIISHKSFTVKEYPDFENTNYTLQAKVKNVEKGSLKRGDIISITYWKAKKRPRGLVGPQGLRGNPLQHGTTSFQFFLFDQEDDGTYQVITPNGWQHAK